MRNEFRRPPLAATACLLILTGSILAACGDEGARAEEHLARAASYLEKNDARAAVIELKAALQAEPDNALARAQLGRVYVAEGLGVQAVKELERARKLGAADPELGLSLARALVMSGNPEGALELVAAEAGDGAAWKVVEGDALLALQRADEARAAYEAALERDGNDTAAHRGLARVALTAGELESARGQLDTAIGIRDGEAMTWLLKGEIEQAMNDSAAAETSFRKVLELSPGSPVAQMGLARALLAQRKTDAAREPLAALERAKLENPLFHYLRGVEARQHNDLKAAQEALREALRLAPNHAPSQLLMGQVNLLQRDFDQAQAMLGRYVTQVPGDPSGRKLLAAVQIELNQARSAIETLEPLDAAGSPDAQVLSLLGTAYMKLGDAERGKAYLARATEASPDTNAIRTQLAVSHLASGDAESAANELEAVIERDPQFARADFLLVLTRLRQGDSAAALTAAKNLVDKHQDSAEAYNLLGAVHEAAGDRGSAREAYLRSTELAPEGRAAQLNLARLALIEGDAEAAREGFEAVLERQPNEVVALMGLARMASEAGETERALDLLEKARRENPGAVRPRLVLGSYFLRRGAAAEALAVAREAYESASDSPAVALLYGRAQLASGQQQDAVRTFEAMTRASPDVPVGYFHLALAQRANGRIDAARRSLQRALELAPDNHLARATLGQLEVAAGRTEEALAIADRLQRDLPDAPAAAVLRGDVAFASGDPEAAATRYAEGFEKSPSSVLMRKLFLAEERAGRREQAHERARAWLEKNPTDSAMRSLLAAAVHGEAGGGDKVVPEYERVLETDPRNVVALNNLAWLYHLRGDPRALDLARRAYELVPGRAEIADTYGWLLVEDGQVEQGLALIDRALQSAPENRDIRYHQAAALHRAGESARARELLRALLDDATDFSERSSADALLKSLGDG